ncbi:hypothetical protein [Azospirillum canadense]|uniref:hypothetical protein n=1 Tax=Azospirillum canadense TaxID=403962 RepID=UPI002226703F|nr:hypothetical protein [Azospirillum canadense]MCW2242277.1 hypothetical protein [Azospirillum canadense]
MQSPDLCTALIGLIDTAYKAGDHLDADGAVKRDWLYAAVAMAAIGHSARDRIATLAAAALSSLSNSERTAFADAYELPPAVTRLLMAGPVEWPVLPAAAPVIPVYVPPAPTAEDPDDESPAREAADAG